LVPRAVAAVGFLLLFSLLLLLLLLLLIEVLVLLDFGFVAAAFPRR
jgi:hypothetical protein